MKTFYTSHIKLPVNYDHYGRSNPPKGLGYSCYNRMAMQDNNFLKKVCKFHMYDGNTEDELNAEINIRFPPPMNMKINMMPMFLVDISLNHTS